MEHHLFTSFFVIFTGAAVLATLSLYTKQPIIVAYVAVGLIAGPSGLQYVSDPLLISEIAHIGIVFLLFLLGLDMQPSSLMHVIKKVSPVALMSSIVFFGFGYVFGSLFGFSQIESLIIGAAMMFSSTIVGIKLLPTTVLHHKHMGEIMIGLLLLQDILAILVLIVLDGASGQGSQNLAITLLSLPTLILIAYSAVRWVVLPLLMKFDLFHEYLFLVAIGWCLGVAELGGLMGLSKEMGAFIAGITLATHPVSQFMTEKLKPIRDFFLVLFFFGLGAGFDLRVLGDIWMYSIILTVAVLIIKPATFKFLLSRQSETPKLAWDIGFRLGQISEFSLLISYLAASALLIGKEAAHLIQATAILTFILSTYIVIFNYPNPIAPSEHLRRD